MAHGSADIESVQVLKDFRVALVKFESLCRNALVGVDAEIKRTMDWLGSQIPLLERRSRKDEEAVNRALSELKEAQWRATYAGKASYVDERRALDRAKRRKEETEARLAAARRWRTVLDQTIGKMVTPCNILAVQLDHLTPRALARLDQMLDSLEDYFRTPTPEPP
jgi:hypothetical protein